jgi:hypothetical protein
MLIDWWRVKMFLISIVKKKFFKILKSSEMIMDPLTITLGNRAKIIMLSPSITQEMEKSTWTLSNNKKRFISRMRIFLGLYQILQKVESLQEESLPNTNRKCLLTWIAFHLIKNQLNLPWISKSHQSNSLL